jgi:hypothetical protein
MKATRIISTIALFVMLTGTACADHQDNDQSSQDQTGTNSLNQNNTNKDTQDNQPKNANPSTPSDDNSSDKIVLPVPMQ